MGDFFKSTPFKILLGLFIVLFAFMLRAAWTGGLSPELEQGVGIIAVPFQKSAAAISGFVTRYDPSRTVDPDGTVTIYVSTGWDDPEAPSEDEPVPGLPAE